MQPAVILSIIYHENELRMEEVAVDENRQHKQEQLEFQTEVKRMLDIVVHSLYTDKDIFLRELISNAADALEKARYIEVSGQQVSACPLEIRIDTDEKAGTLTIRDTGIGMSRDEIIENLGTIAHSGAKKFLETLGQKDSSDVNLIGQFGVGFYSAFMVSDRVELLSRSIHGDNGVRWTSQGDGTYTIEDAEVDERGTTITLYMKKDTAEYADPLRVKEIIRQYSSFVSFPIHVDGEKVNTIGALWLKNKNEVETQDYEEFYKFLAEDYMNPLLHYHFSVDAPLSINAVLFCPAENMEMRGLGQMEHGVRLYSRRVMIRERAEDLLPSWMRFLRGVIDSDEIPLNISRETMQDRLLMQKIGRVITGRFLSYLDELSRKDPEAYLVFYKKFGVFLKEGLAGDSEHTEKLLKLLRFEISDGEAEEMVSLDEYLDRGDEPLEAIYYISGSSRNAIEQGPYLEVFREKNIPVLYSYEGLDDYVLSMAGAYREVSFVSAESADLSLEREMKLMTEEEAVALAQWMAGALGEKVTDVSVSRRLTGSPALVKNPSGIPSNLERWFSMMNQEVPRSPKVLEINPDHGLIAKINELREKDEDRARRVADQVFDNAMLSAGLPVDIQEMVNRMNGLLEESLSEQA